jgi:uncharacterized protein YjbI with pentapeptide repeats
LTKANLNWAKLTGANLTEANLTGVQLSGIHLYETKLDGAFYNGEQIKRYLIIDNVGSRCDTLITFITGSNIFCKTGCFTGTLCQLINAVDPSIKGQTDYLAMEGFIRAIANMEAQD